MADEKQKATRQDYQEVFGTEPGRRVLADIMDLCGYHKSTFSENERLSVLLQGERQVAIKINKRMKGGRQHA